MSRCAKPKVSRHRPPDRALAGRRRPVDRHRELHRAPPRLPPAARIAAASGGSSRARQAPRRARRARRAPTRPARRAHPTRAAGRRAATPGSVTPVARSVPADRASRAPTRAAPGCAPPDRSRRGSSRPARAPPSAGRAPRPARRRLQRRQQQLPFALRRVGVRRRAGQRPEPLEHHERREHPLVAERQHRHLAERVQLEEPVGRRKRHLASRRSASRHSRTSTRAMRANGEPGK